MKFLYGDEERFLLDRIKELNRNFDKEERVKLLRMEVKKREKILRKRWKKYRYVISSDDSNPCNVISILPPFVQAINLDLIFFGLTPESISYYIKYMLIYNRNTTSTGSTDLKVLFFPQL